MRSIAFFVLILVCGITANANPATYAIEFSYDEQSIRAELEKVNELEAFLLENNSDNLNAPELGQLVVAANLVAQDPKTESNPQWKIDWGSVAIGAVGCLVIEGVCYLGFFLYVMQAYGGI